MIENMANWIEDWSDICYPPQSYWPAELTKSHFKKWLRFADFVKTNDNPCLSRQIGVVIIDPRADSVVSTGHNGPPGNLPPCDDSTYLLRAVAPQLTRKELMTAVSSDPEWDEKQLKNEFVRKYKDCGTCPRKLVGAPSGQRLELCTCIHGETDAITRARRDLSSCWMICACGVPCIECTKIILESRLEAVVAWDHGKGPAEDYSPHSSRWMFEQSEKTRLILVPQGWSAN